MSNSRNRKEAHRESRRGPVKDLTARKQGTLVHHVVPEQRFVLRPEDFGEGEEVEVETKESPSEKWFNPFGLF